MTSSLERAIERLVDAKLTGKSIRMMVMGKNHFPWIKKTDTDDVRTYIFIFASKRRILQIRAGIEHQHLYSHEIPLGEAVDFITTYWEQRL